MPTVLKYLFNLLYRLLFGTMKKKKKSHSNANFERKQQTITMNEKPQSKLLLLMLIRAIEAAVLMALDSTFTQT